MATHVNIHGGENTLPTQNSESKHEQTSTTSLGPGPAKDPENCTSLPLPFLDRPGGCGGGIRTSTRKCAFLGTLLSFCRFCDWCRFCDVSDTHHVRDNEGRNSPGEEGSAISTSSSPGSVPASVPGPDGPWGGGELSPASSPLWVKALLSLSSNPANLSFSLCLCFFPTSLPLTLEFGALPAPVRASGGDNGGVGVEEAVRRRRAAK